MLQIQSRANSKPNTTSPASLPTVQCPRCPNGILSLVTVDVDQLRMFVCIG